jgi:hypothetical protein
MFQQHGHNDRLKRPRAREVHAGLGLELGAVKEPVEDALIGFAERWVRSVKDEALSRMILCGEGSLRRVLNEYVEHYHRERNHQGKGNVLLFPAVGQDMERQGVIQYHERLGGLLKYYERKAA